jgi:molybdate transport system substrate-binding protein
LRLGGIVRSLACLGLAAAAAGRAAGTLSIAAAANLTYALDGLDAEFNRAEPGVKVTTALGASGSLVAQIRNGAPFDLFLGADREFPAALVRTGDGIAATLTPFARGRLVLWTIRPALEVGDVAAAVRNPLVLKLAIANTDTAPYGRAARQAMEKLGVWEAARAKLVTAENISQAAQFVDTGNADAGFVALSAVMSPKLRGRGRWTEVPSALYEPLVQFAVVTRHGQDRAEAARYLAFLRGPEARAVLERLGYGSPPP